MCVVCCVRKYRGFVKIRFNSTMSTYTLVKAEKLPKSLGDRLEDIDLQSLDRLPGGFTSDAKLCWVASGSYLEVLRTKTAETVSCWNFGSVLKVMNSKIVSVDELKSSLNEVIMLVVGLEYLGAAGMVCLYDIYSMKVIRAIQIPEKVTFVHVIYNGNEHTTFPGVLNSFDGALAVGTVDGNVYIVDLCREVINEARQTSPMPAIKDEVDPCTLMILRSEDLYNIESHKEEADRKENHLAIHLNALVGEESPHFILKGPKGDTRLFVNKEEVFVSSLHFAPQLSSLLVGYNFGALQLWDLISMNLVYTSPVCEDNIPISHFAVQEPVDDPRAFCYFWAVYSDMNSCGDSFPAAALYSLCYDTKEWHDGYGYIYQNLQSCNIRFQTDLAVMDKSGVKNPVGGQCVRLHSLSNVKSKDLGSSSIAESYEEPYKLCLMVWNVWSKDRSSQVFLSVFDLNQWYKEQMPNFPSGDHSKKYMTTVCISDVSYKQGEPKFPAIDIHIDPSTISMFKGAQNLEEHYYPTSLAFDCHLLTECSVIHLKNYGVQRKFFHTLGEDGPLALLKPAGLYEKSIEIGLTPLFMEPTQVHLTNATQQREHILSIALENKMRNWLYKCASSWGNGSHRAAGLSLDLLLNWAWNRAKILKTSADDVCATLFDFSSVKMDPNCMQILNKCRLQILVIKDLYKFVRANGAQYLINPNQTKKQHECLERIFAYLDVLGWMYNVGLLPEHHPSDETELIPYKLEYLAKLYEERRGNLRLLDGQKQLFGKEPVLFIDKFIKMCESQELDEEWTRACRGSNYPPTSLQALLRTYLVEDMELEMKHVIVSYLFMDIADSLDPDEHKLSIANLLKFPVIFQFTRSQLKLIQGFWHLDHNQLGSAGELFIDPMLESRDLQQWHHKHILSTFMLHNSNKLALLYLTFQKPPIGSVRDVSTVIIVYINNKMIQEAFNLHREHSPKNDRLLLKIIFKELLRTRQLKSLLTISLTRLEEEELFAYLDKVSYRSQSDYKAVYYSMKGRHFDLKLNVKLSKSDPDDFSLSEVCTNILDTMVPPETKKMVDLCLTEKNSLLKSCSSPKPMSSFLFKKSENVKYKSDFSYACVAKAHEVWSDASDRTSYFRNTDSKLCSDDFPFLWTKNTIPYKSKYNSQLIYPKIVTTFQKQPVFEEEEEDGPSPKKRLKLSPRASVHTPQTTKEDPNIKKVLTNFDTPVISASLAQPNYIAEATPQSILKEHSVQREVAARLSYLSTPSNFATSSDKPAASFEKRVILTPSKRRSVVRFTDVTSANNSSLSAQDLLENVQMDISPLPDVADTNVSQKSYVDMDDESTSESFHSPNISGVIDKPIEGEVIEKRVSTLIEKANKTEDSDDLRISSKRETVTDTSFTKKISSTTIEEYSFVKKTSMCIEERNFEAKSMALSQTTGRRMFDVFEEREQLPEKDKDEEDKQINTTKPNVQEVRSLRESMTLRNRSLGSPVPATLRSRKSYKDDVVKVTKTNLSSQYEDSPPKATTQEKTEGIAEEEPIQLEFKRSKSPLLGKRTSALMLSTEIDRSQSPLSRRSYRDEKVISQQNITSTSVQQETSKHSLTRTSTFEKKAEADVQQETTKHCLIRTSTLEEKSEAEKPVFPIEDDEMIEVISLSSRTTIDEDAAFYEKHIKGTGVAEDSSSSGGDSSEILKNAPKVAGKLYFGPDSTGAMNSSKLASTIIDDDSYCKRDIDEDEYKSVSEKNYSEGDFEKSEASFDINQSKTRDIESDDNVSDVILIQDDAKASEVGSEKSDFEIESNNKKSSSFQKHEEIKSRDVSKRSLKNVQSFESVDSNKSIDDFERNILESSRESSAVASPSKSPSRSKKRSSLRTSIFKPACRRSLRSNSPKTADSSFSMDEKKNTIGLNAGFIESDATFSEENIFERNISSNDISTAEDNSLQRDRMEIAEPPVAAEVSEERTDSFKDAESNEFNKACIDFDVDTETQDESVLRGGAESGKSSVVGAGEGGDSEKSCAEKLDESRPESVNENAGEVGCSKDLDVSKVSEGNVSVFEDAKDTSVPEGNKSDIPEKTSAVSTPRKLKKKDEPALLDSPARRTRANSATTPPLSTRSLRSRRSVSIEVPNESPKTPRRRSSVTAEKVEPKSPATRTRRASTSTEPGISMVPPTRRTTRAKSVDAVIEEAPKSEQKTRGRKSLLPVITEDLPALEEYSVNRRLTRKQKELFLKNMKGEAGDKLKIDLQSIDPMQLLDKEDFKGKADPDEQQLLQHSPAPSVISSSATETGNRKERGISSDRSISEVNLTPTRKNLRSASKPKDDQPGTSAARRVTRRTSRDSAASDASNDVKKSPVKHALSNISEDPREGESTPKTKRGRRKQ